MMHMLHIAGYSFTEGLLAEQDRPANKHGSNLDKTVQREQHVPAVTATSDV